MAIDTSPSHHSRSSCFALLLFVFLLLLPAPARAGELRPPTPHGAIVLSTPVLANGGWSWRNLFAPVQSALGNRRRMIQFATIGMCIGLYILMRK